MKANDVFPSKWLKVPDLQGHEPHVIISSVGMEEVAPGEHKPIMHFRGFKGQAIPDIAPALKKGMVVNRTNWMAIAFRYGDESDEWIGKDIILFAAMVQTPSGKPVEGLRVKLPPMQRTNAIPVKRAEAAPLPDEGFDDEIPGWGAEDVR